MYYYHITDVKTAFTILKKGLKANEEGDIFLFENVSFTWGSQGIRNTVADSIAENQIFLKEYAILRVNSKGITGEVINDNVGELSSPFQWIVKQPLIEAKYLKFIKVCINNYRPFLTVSE